MNKLQKMKLDEIEKELYNINCFISLHYIGMKKQHTEEEMMKINDVLARCIRNLRLIQ
jgi:hypothetical protein